MASTHPALDANVQRLAAEAATAPQPPAPLNPAFPWKATPFDPFYFGVAADPVVKQDAGVPPPS